MRLAFLSLLSVTSIAVHAASPDPRLQGAYKFDQGGWTYVHLQGTPAQIGYQHGYLLAREIEDNVNVQRVEVPHMVQREWSFFRDAAKTILWPHIEPEYQQELKGIAAGLHAQGSPLDLWDVVALNGIIELRDYYLPALNEKDKKPNPPEAAAPGKCSAFIATGSASPITTGLRTRKANAGLRSSILFLPADSISSWMARPASSPARTISASTPAAS